MISKFEERDWGIFIGTQRHATRIHWHMQRKRITLKFEVKKQTSTQKIVNIAQTPYSEHARTQAIVLTVWLNDDRTHSHTLCGFALEYLWVKLENTQIDERTQVASNQSTNGV